jgi:hypothetical protein
VKGILKWPLIIAASVGVARVIVERSGAPESVSNLVSAVALHAVIIPIYLAVRIAKSGISRPYATLFKLVAIYVTLVRAMLLPPYWLAHIFGWGQTRFTGLGPEASFVEGIIAIPILTGVFWVLASVVFGGGLGSLIIALTRKTAVSQSAR